MMNDALMGSVTLPKILLDRDVLLQEPANRRSALVDLWTWANDRDRIIKVAGRDVPLKRGQLAYSQVTLAKLWRWDKEKVRRTLVEFQNEGLITYDATNTTTIITVLDYTIYNTDSAAVPDAEPLAEPLPETLPKPAAEPLQKLEVGSRKKEEEEDAHARNQGFSGYLPEDCEVLEFAAKFAGEPASGTPGPITPDFASGWLARMLGRREFPPRWQRALVADWRASSRGITFPAGPNGSGGVKKKPAPMGATATRIGMEREAKKLRDQLNASPVRPDTDTDLSFYQPEELKALRTEYGAAKARLGEMEAELSKLAEGDE